MVSTGRAVSDLMQILDFKDLMGFLGAWNRSGLFLHAKVITKRADCGRLNCWFFTSLPHQVLHTHAASAVVAL